MRIPRGAFVVVPLALVAALAACSSSVRSWPADRGYPGGAAQARVPGQSTEMVALTLIDLAPQGYAFRLLAPAGAEVEALPGVEGGVRLTHRSGWDLEIVPGGFEPTSAVERIRNDPSREFVAFHSQGSDTLVWETRQTYQRASDFHFLATVDLANGQSYTCRDGARPQSHARALEMVRACWALEASGPSEQIQQPQQEQPQMSPGMDLRELPLPPVPGPEQPPAQPSPEPIPDEPPSVP